MNNKDKGKEKNNDDDNGQEQHVGLKERGQTAGMQSRSVPIDAAIDCDTLSTLEVTARNSFLPRLRDRSDSDRNDFCSRLARFYGGLSHRLASRKTIRRTIKVALYRPAGREPSAQHRGISCGYNCGYDTSWNLVGTNGSANGCWLSGE